MKPLYLIAAIGVALLTACNQQNNFPPPVTEQAARYSPHAVVELQKGRELFARRCNECHVLPAVASNPANEWPHIVEWMARRADISEIERKLITSYLVAAREDKL